jgi:hypothetical protein
MNKYINLFLILTLLIILTFQLIAKEDSPRPASLNNKLKTSLPSVVILNKKTKTAAIIKIQNIIEDTNHSISNNVIPQKVEAPESIQTKRCYQINYSDYSLSATRDCEINVIVFLNDKLTYSEYLYLSERDKISVNERIDLKNECELNLIKNPLENVCSFYIKLQLADNEDTDDFRITIP